MIRSASASFFVSSRSTISPSAGSGVTESTVCPSTSAAIVAFAKPGPISVATSIGRIRREYSRKLPSGSLTLSISTIAWAKIVP